MLISPQRTLLLYISVWQTAKAWKAHCGSLSLPGMELIQETHCRLSFLNSYVVDPVLHELEYSNVCRIDVCLEVILTLFFCAEVEAASCFNASLLHRNAVVEKGVHKQRVLAWASCITSAFMPETKHAQHNCCVQKRTHTVTSAENSRCTFIKPLWHCTEHLCGL